MNEQPPTPETPETAGVVTTTDPAQERAEATAGSDLQIKTIENWMKAEENRPETEQQRKKRERREKSAKVISAVTDGLSALSNLFFTTQYAPSMYSQEGSMTNATNERLERLKAEREKKKDEYLNFALKLGDVYNDRARTVRDLEAKQEARKQAREKAEREAELHPIVKAIKEAEGRKAEQQAIAAQAEAEYAPRMQEAKLATEQARAGAQQASAAASRASAANSYASAASHNRANANEFSAWDEQGNEHKFKTEAAAIAFAKQHGTYQETEQSETTHTTGKSAQGRPVDQTATKTTRKGHAARPQKKESPTAGGGGGKKSPTS